MTINNNNIFGAFTLNEARGSRLTGDWLNKESVANYGWFGGGSVPATVSTVDRIDFSNDSATASVRGPLSAAKYGVAATGNSNYGWFGGGAFFPGGTVYSTVDRIDFSNDSSTASQRGPLTLARFGPIATGNSNYGWFGGGSITAPIAAYSTVDRIDFSNDSSTASQRGPLTLARYGPIATGNSNYGWFGGGITAASVLLSTVDRIDFSNDSSTASQRGPLSSTRYRLASTGNSNYGWFGGGNPTALDSVTIVNRIDFSNDSAAASVRGPLTLARYSLAATGNSNYGWFGGGYNFSLATKYSSINRIDFSNDSVTASLRGGSLNAPAGRYFIAATSGVLNIRRQKAGNFGWFGGGGLPQVATVDRVNFSNDSVSAIARGSLSQARWFLAATGNSNYGWFGGGNTPTSVATVDRVDFSNDSPAGASPRGPLSSTRYSLAATGNSNYGWFGGGRGGTPIATVATVDRIDFSNDSVSASPRGPLSSARYSLAATGNSNYGWFGGGYIISAFPAVRATVDRINFSNDSVSASPRSPLSSARYRLGATGNSNYGWFGGGSTGALAATVDRIDFSNDSVSAIARGSLSQAKQSLAATGNSNYGWFGGGSIPASTATVDRVDFSNDSVATSPRGPLSSARSGPGATSNTPT
jgi:hypothetical protein